MLFFSGVVDNVEPNIYASVCGWNDPKEAHRLCIFLPFCYLAKAEVVTDKAAVKAEVLLFAWRVH